VAATFANGTVQLFVNGVGNQPTSIGTVLQPDTGSLRIGQVDGYATTFVGMLDDIRISSEVLYTANFTPPLVLPAPGASTLGQWEFNQGTGQSALDSSSAARHGTLGSTPDADASDPTWIAADRY
jgi:hypothetical protein